MTAPSSFGASFALALPPRRSANADRDSVRQAAISFLYRAALPATASPQAWPPFRYDRFSSRSSVRQWERRARGRANLTFLKGPSPPRKRMRGPLSRSGRGFLSAECFDPNKAHWPTPPPPPPDYPSRAHHCGDRAEHVIVPAPSYRGRARKENSAPRLWLLLRHDINIVVDGARRPAPRHL